MPRSRAILLVAWGLLAAGTVAQFVGAGTEHPGAATAVPPGDDPGRLAFIDPIDPTPTEATTTDGAAQAIGRTGLGPPPVDPPIRRVTARAPAPPAMVATVAGDGIGSLAEPSPGSPVYWFPNPTQFGGDRTFLVIDDDTSSDYVKVSLPVMPNGQEGWLPRDQLELSTVSYRAEVDLSAATVTVWDGPELVVTTRAVTGRPSAPTPLGRFYIRDIIAQANPDGDYGPWILALSGFSETLTIFDGGLPALALHGTDRSDLLGSAISSGCVRVPNEVITLLAETVPLGTPVTVVA